VSTIGVPTAATAAVGGTRQLDTRKKKSGLVRSACDWCYIKHYECRVVGEGTGCLRCVAGRQRCSLLDQPAPQDANANLVTPAPPTTTAAVANSGGRQQRRRTLIDGAGSITSSATGATDVSPSDSAAKPQDAIDEDEPLDIEGSISPQREEDKAAFAMADGDDDVDDKPQREPPQQPQQQQQEQQ
jgi:hypothetical protein